MKTSFQRLKSRVVNYRDYRSLKNKVFWEELLYEFSSATFEENTNSFEEVNDVCQKNSKQLCPSQTKVCRRQPFAIYEHNPFESDNA